MSTATQTRIFGIRLGIDPKLIVLALIAVAGLLFWYNSRGDEDAHPATTAAAHLSEPAAVTVPTGATRTRPSGQRRRGRDERGTLKLPAVVPANGDIDPILRVDLLDRLAKVELPAANRNLFESGPTEAEMLQAAVPNRVIPLKPVAALTPPTVVPQPPVMPQVNIPLKYYGFARPSSTAEANRGFFMDGDDILVAAERPDDQAAVSGCAADGDGGQTRRHAHEDGTELAGDAGSNGTRRQPGFWSTATRESIAWSARHECGFWRPGKWWGAAGAMSGRRERQKGSALLIVFVFAAIVAISLYMELPVAAFEAQRQKEELLMTRGNEYAHAVKLFVRKTGRYPASLKQLEDTNRMRFLRHDYADPLTGKKDWRLLHAGPGGVIIDSKVSNGILLPGMQPGGGTNGGGTPTSTAAFPNGNSGGSQSGFGSGSFASSGSSFGANNGSNQPAQSTGFSSASDQSASQPEVTVQQPRQRAPAVSANGSGQVVNPEAALEANAMALPPTTGDGQGAAGAEYGSGTERQRFGKPGSRSRVSRSGERECERTTTGCG